MGKLLSRALALIVAGIVNAAADTFPSRPISIVVPFPAGGPTDTLGRILADRMKQTLGQSVIIENLTGAAGTVGKQVQAVRLPESCCDAQWLTFDVI